MDPGFSGRARAGFRPNFDKNVWLILDRIRELAKNFFEHNYFVSFVYSESNKTILQSSRLKDLFKRTMKQMV